MGDLDPTVLHVRYARCATCVFGRRSPLRAGALEQRLRRIDAAQSYQECHHYTARRTQRGGPGVCCRGFWDRGSGLVCALARRYGWVRFVDDDGHAVPTREERGP